MADAILFNGAAALIAQEAGILDLLLGDGEDAPGVLNTSNVQFVGGLSSGALMTFTFNAAFSDNPQLTWENFKEDVLFQLTTDKIYRENDSIKDTTPLSELLTTLTNQVGLHLIKDLPFESAILVSYPYLHLFVQKYRVFWLTNIANVAQELPRDDDTPTTAGNIKTHQPDITLVSALMSSTAIPLTFPKQNLLYKDSPNNPPQTIKDRNNNDAEFIDGGFVDQSVFTDFQNFFDVYNQKFDNIYFISPNYSKLREEFMNRISSMESSNTLEQAVLFEADFFVVMDNYTKTFLKKIRDYNSDCRLANKIYYCKAEVGGYELLRFDEQKKQYDDTIQWGRENPDSIAIDITTIPDSELEVSA